MFTFVQRRPHSLLCAAVVLTGVFAPAAGYAVSSHRPGEHAHIVLTATPRSPKGLLGPP
jgi:hypothetical protein